MAAETPAEPESGRRGASPEAIVILGGFMSLSAWYSAMRLALVRLTGQPVYVVATRSAHWIPSMVPSGWLYSLELGFLGLGWFGSLLVAYRLAEGDQPSQPWRIFVPWAVLLSVLFATAIWLMSQPMEMRGTFMAG